MAGAALLVVALLFAVVAPLALYYLVRAEHGERERMGRRAAERVARRDTRDRAQREGTDRRTTDGDDDRDPDGGEATDRWATDRT